MEVFNQLLRVVRHTHLLVRFHLRVRCQEVLDRVNDLNKPFSNLFFSLLSSSLEHDCWHLIYRLNIGILQLSCLLDLLWKR